MSISNEALFSLIRSNPLKTGCIALSALSAVGIYLAQGRIDDAALMLQQKTADGRRLEDNVRNAAQLAEQLDTLTVATEKINGRLVSASQLATNLQYFYRLETDAGVEIIDLRQTTSSGAGKGGKAASSAVGFAVSVKGDYESVLGWLRRLEKGRHFCRVLSATVTGTAPDRAGPITINVALELFGQP